MDVSPVTVSMHFHGLSPVDPGEARNRRLVAALRDRSPRRPVGDRIAAILGARLAARRPADCAACPA
jgi:hypothetical protein